MPIGDDRNLVTDTNGSITDVIGVGPVLQQVPNVVQSTAQNLASWAAAPGNVFAGQQPQTPGMWSDVDEAIAQANIAGQFGWAPETAMLMLGTGGAPAEASLTAGRPSIEYLNARRALRKGSDYSKNRKVKYAPEAETMTPEELTAAKVESDWAMQNMQQEAFWDKLFEQFGQTRGYSLDETFGSGSRKLAPVGAVAFTEKLPKHAEEVFAEGGATVHKLQKPGRYPTYVATSPEGEAYQFKDFKKAKRWATPQEVQRPDPAAPGELPPWEDSGEYNIMGYHGTQSSRPIETFETGDIYDDAGNLVHAGSGDPNSYIGPHFSAEPKVASKFAFGKGAQGYSDWLQSRYTEGSPTVYPVKLHGGKVKKFTSEDELNDFVHSHSANTHTVEMILDDEPGGIEEAGEKYDSDPEYRAEINRRAVEDESKYDEPSHETAEQLGSAARSSLEGEGWTTIQYPNAVEGGTSYIAIKRPLSRYTGTAMSGAALAVAKNKQNQTSAKKMRKED